MPISNPLHLPTVVYFTQVLAPARVLDIGVGTGTYGFVLRQYLDVGHGRVGKETWKATIEGVEVFAPYRNPVWDYAYDKVWQQDVREFVKTMGRYDLVVCNDVLEHLELSEAGEIVATLLRNCRAVIVSTPNVDIPQGAWGGNEAETHHCLVTRKDLPDVVVEKKTGITSVFVCAREPATVATLEIAAASCPTCRTEPWALLRGQMARVVRRLRRAIG